MKKLSLILAGLVLFGSISFAGPRQEVKEKKVATKEKKVAVKEKKTAAKEKAVAKKEKKDAK
jgi:hypothetical protein